MLCAERKTGVLPPGNGKKGGLPMDTLVELYDKEPLENVLAGLYFFPKRVVYLCDGRASSIRKEACGGALFQSRGRMWKRGSII